MTTFERVILAISMAAALFMSFVAIGAAGEQNDKLKDIEKRIIVIETKINLYHGYTGACEN